MEDLADGNLFQAVQNMAVRIFLITMYMEERTGQQNFRECRMYQYIQNR